MGVKTGTEAIFYTREGRSGQDSSVIEPFNVIVLILDQRVRFGKDRYLVTPKFGEGSIWVDGSRLTFMVKEEEGQLTQKGRKR